VINLLRKFVREANGSTAERLEPTAELRQGHALATDLQRLSMPLTGGGGGGGGGGLTDPKGGGGFTPFLYGGGVGGLFGGGGFGAFIDITLLPSFFHEFYPLHIL
jgi:hypothetical protein